jgi:hypothetical protein
MCAKLEIVPNKSVREELIRLAHGVTFPFFVLKLEEAKKDESTVTLKVSSEIYNDLVKRYDSDEMIIYIDAARGKMESWSPDMVYTFKTLHNIGIFPTSASWVKAARKHISNLFTEERFEDIVAIESVKDRLTKIEALLGYAGIKSELETRKDLFSIAKDVKNSNSKDPTSIIYRLSMTLYHSDRLSGEAAVPQLEDPGVLYLNLMDNSGFKTEFPSIHAALVKITPNQRSALIKTFMSFVIGSYLYYKGTYDLGDD